MAKYLDWAGLQHFWGKIKEYIKITTQNSLTTIHIGNNNVIPVTKVIAGDGLNTTSNDSGVDGGTIGETVNSGTIYLTKSGVTAGSYGPSTNVSPAAEQTFDVPQVTVDKYGRVTAASTKTVTIPAAPNSFNISVSDNLLDGTGGANSVQYAPYSTKGAGHLYTGTTDPTNTNRLNYDGAFYATNFNGKTLGQGNSSLTTSDTTKIPTSAEVASFIDTKITEAQVGAAMFQGVIKSGTTLTELPSTGYKKGWYWIVGTAGTYAGIVCEAGDTIFCVKDYVSGSAGNSDFNVIQTNIETISTSDIDGLSGIPQTNS